MDTALRCYGVQHCNNVLQCVAVCCNVVHHCEPRMNAPFIAVQQHTATMCCSVLHHVASPCAEDGRSLPLVAQLRVASSFRVHADSVIVR